MANTSVSRRLVAAQVDELCEEVGLTCVSRVGGAVQEAGGPGHAQVGHPGAVSVHGGRDGVVVGLLRC